LPNKREPAAEYKRAARCDRLVIMVVRRKEWFITSGNSYNEQRDATRKTPANDTK